MFKNKFHINMFMTFCKNKVFTIEQSEVKHQKKFTFGREMTHPSQIVIPHTEHRTSILLILSLAVFNFLLDHSIELCLFWGLGDFFVLENHFIFCYINIFFA